MKHAFAIRTAIQAICDQLPPDGYEAYIHQQAAAFALESMIILPGPEAGNSTAPRTASVEFLLEGGWLTLTGHGADCYSALKDALNVCAPTRTILEIR
jgi:hypothetical protein